MREDAKRIRIEVIKQQILHKLRLTAIPNITLANRPRLPPILSHLVDEFGGRTGHAHATADDVTNDEANHGDDDYHATTTKVIKFGEKRKKNKRASKEGSKHGRKKAINSRAMVSEARGKQDSNFHLIQQSLC
jgi:hypothetical protein